MKSKHLLLILVLVAMTFSCKKSTPTLDNIYRFREYISYTSSGLVSTKEPIRINLTKEVEGWEIDQELPKDLLDIKPYVEGSLKAVNKHALLFIPDEPLNPDTEYTVTLKLGKIFPSIGADFKEYTFQFKTITPNFTVHMGNLQSYSKDWQYMEATLESADVISLESAKELVEVLQGDRKLSTEWNEFNSEAKTFEFRIDSIQRFVEDGSIVFKWNGKAIGAETEGENTITIPGKNNFRIVDLKVEQSPEQFLAINFSDPLKKQQNFEGLVTIQNCKSPKFIVDGNVLNVYPDTKLVGTILVEVFQGIKNTEGYKLKQPFSESISFEELKPQVRLLSNGVILPNSQDLKFNFEAVNLRAVDVRIIKIFEDNVLQFLQDSELDSDNEHSIKRVGRRIAKQTITLVENPLGNTGKWKAYSIELSKFFKADPGAIYRVELSFNKEYSLYNCEANQGNSNSEEEDEDYYYYDDYYDYGDGQYNSESESLEDEELREEAYWDNQLYSYRNRNYNWQERNNPCHEAYYSNKKVVAQNLMASNLGVIVKQGSNNSYHIAVSDILTTQPESNATLTLYNFQQQAIASTTTNSNGLAILDVEKHASFAIVRKNNNTTYVKLADGNSLSLSKFDVSGNKLQRGLKGYIYGERGVWRPGDTLFLTFVLNDKANPLPKGHPVKLEVTDPMGKLIYKSIGKMNDSKFFPFPVPTSSEDKTGNYTAKVSVGGAQFYKQLKVETVKPNRLKLKIDFDKEVLSSNEPLQGTLDVKWLHGAPAKNLKTDIQVKFRSNSNPFKDYKDYVFSDPTKEFTSEETTIFEDKVNEEGIANINTSLKVEKNAPGMLTASFLVRAFENGGDFSIDAFSKPYAPYESFVGLQSPKAQAYGSFFTDEDQNFDVIVLDKDSKPLKRDSLEVKIYKIEWRWWWNSSYDNLSSYISSKFHLPYKSFMVKTRNNGKGSFKLNIPEDDRGRYLIRIVDPKSGHATGRVAYFYKNWWGIPTGDKEAAKMLVFSADKEQYKIGETAKITFPSGSEGRALVSIENGTEVLQQQWVVTKPGETKVDVVITKEMAPNVFVNISLLQPHTSVSNDLPIRLYGVIPLNVENPNTKLQPQLKMPDVLRPEQEFEIAINEKNNKPMTYTIAIVDEGLLDLTRFQTPNIWNEFYKRQALGVKTWDIYDDVIGAYGGSVEQVFAIGGDGSAAGAKNKKANRFKPVVIYLGPFSLNAGETKVHTVKLPNYIGAVRTMIVAGNNVMEAYGSTDKSVQVKKPLMVLASLPRKLSPGEKVTLPVTVFAMEPKVKDVKVTLKLSDGVKVVGSQSQNLSFAKPDEQMAFFELDVSEGKGIQTIEVQANGNGETASYKVEMDVFNPNPYSSTYHTVTLEPNATETLTFDTFGVPGTNTAQIEFSTLPPMNFSGRLEYLIRYPHGCVEQTTSSIFPQLFLSDIFDLTIDKKKDIQKNIEKGIQRLAQFQNSSGGLGYWMGENTTNDWGTSYAGHFMLEAEKQGYALPVMFKSNWLRYQQKAARDWRPTYRVYNSDLAQAYRLYTLALAGQPDLTSMNRLREFSELSNEAKWRLAAAYALAGQKEASDNIAASANIEFKPLKGDYYTYGSIDRNRAMALETMVLTKNPKTRELSELIAKDLSSKRWMSTQTTAYSLLAMSKMVKANGGKAMNVSFADIGGNTTIASKNAIAQRNLTIKDGTNGIKVSNDESNVVYVRILNSGKLPLGKELSEQRGLSVSVAYTDTKGNPINVSKLQQGQDFVATIKVSNLSKTQANDIALTQIFPSGWDIVNTRFTDFAGGTSGTARYTDIRDDRVNFYFDLGTSTHSSIKTFTVLLNASYLGTYYLPGTQAEAMYDNDYLVRNKGQWVEVTK